MVGITSFLPQEFLLTWLNRGGMFFTLGFEYRKRILMYFLHNPLVLLTSLFLLFVHNAASHQLLLW